MDLSRDFAHQRDLRQPVSVRNKGNTYASCLPGFFAERRITSKSEGATTVARAVCVRFGYYCRLFPSFRLAFVVTVLAAGSYAPWLQACSPFECCSSSFLHLPVKVLSTILVAPKNSYAGRTRWLQITKFLDVE